MFLMYFIKSSPVKVVDFTPQVCCKVYDTFPFFSACIFAQLF